MGLSPREVDQQQLWPFVAAWDAYKQVHGIRESAKPSGDLNEEDLARMGIEGF
ncbi:hypothetical protein RSK20926_11804 [Roseobacter sp. SK209-2-6]|uniref:hypothetical protein n=1 Tax=Roseobacter sp. SK209-2-6 TaxID=388739 RepID=UPI0000F3C48E|nr:hypothetical protein [Roseobacter sp. SK209-2-6]EBA18402.1 hypothetical protein RSK20926_11804 [Roseobacter sp. SK209-2-6]